MKREITVHRLSDEEITFARINLTTVGNMTDIEILNAVRGAVTEWVDTTEQGAAAFDGSCQDFNVGDLEECMDDYDLNIMLRERGIIEMEIDIVSMDHIASNAWVFDTLLYESAEWKELS